MSDRMTPKITRAAITSGEPDQLAQLRLAMRQTAKALRDIAKDLDGGVLDKRRAVETLLRDEEWSRKSDVWISKTVHVSHTFVAQMRAATCNVAGSEREGQDGKTRKLPAKKAKSAVTPDDVERARGKVEVLDA